MKVTLRVWRQANAQAKGKMAVYRVNDISEDMSFLEMLDVLNERLTLRGEDPIAFDSDCREGICGTCGLVINGVAHGPQQTTTCQLHMRSFEDGDVIDVVERNAGLIEAVLDGDAGEAGPVFDAPEPLFFRRRDELPVDDDTGGGVGVMGVDA